MRTSNGSTGGVRVDALAMAAVAAWAKRLTRMVEEVSGLGSLCSPKRRQRRSQGHQETTQTAPGIGRLDGAPTCPHGGEIKSLGVEFVKKLAIKRIETNKWRKPELTVEK